MKIILFLMRQKYFILSLLVAFLACVSLLHPGLPPTQDGEYHIIRFYEFDKDLRSGNIYPRWAPELNFGYGVPLFTYVYPLPNYLASLFHLFGISFINSFKLDMFAATIVGGIFFYLFVKEYWGERAGFIASSFYSFSPYHFVDIYIRGSVGEVIALGLFPLWLWSYTKFVRTKNVSYFLYSSLSLALIIFSHNILALMFFIFCFPYMCFVILQEDEKKFLSLSSISITIIALGLSAIFWLPALTEVNQVQGLQLYDLQKNFPDFFQLLFPSWGTGFFDNNLTNQMSTQIGTANLLAVLAIFISVLKNIRNKIGNKNTIIFFLLSFFITFFLLTPYSKFIWQYIPLLHYFQFPWRLLSLMILICSFLAGSFFYKKRSIVWVLLFLSILFLTTYDYAHPVFYHLRNDSYYITRSNFIDGTNSPGNAFRTIWTPLFTKRATNTATTLSGTGNIMLQKKTPTQEIYVAKITSPTELQFSKAYLPNWKIFIGNTSLLAKNKNGLLDTALPKGNYTIHVFLADTSLEAFASFLTIFFSVIVFLIIVFIFVRKSL